MITLDQVLKITSQSTVQTVFDLWDAIAVRKKDQAYLILRECQQTGVTLPEMIGLFRWQLTRLVQDLDMGTCFYLFVCF